MKKFFRSLKIAMSSYDYDCFMTFYFERVHNQVFTYASFTPFIQRFKNVLFIANTPVSNKTDEIINEIFYFYKDFEPSLLTEEQEKVLDRFDKEIDACLEAIKDQPDSDKIIYISNYFS